MSVSPRDLEHIVAEVLRRLREREITNEIRAEISKAATAENSLILAEKVVSLASLRDRLAGVERVIVPQGAVVTPLVRDELKSRNVKLEFAESKTGKRAARRLLLVATTTFNPAGLQNRLVAAGIEVEALHAADWKEAVKKMTNELTSPTTAGVILTDCPAAVACHANRDAAVRAAVAVDARSAKDAVDSLGANLFVVDPAAHSLFALENIIREYARSSPRQLPLKRGL